MPFTFARFADRHDISKQYEEQFKREKRFSLVLAEETPWGGKVENTAQDLFGWGNLATTEDENEDETSPTSPVYVDPLHICRRAEDWTWRNPNKKFVVLSNDPFLVRIRQSQYYYYNHGQGVANSHIPVKTKQVEEISKTILLPQLFTDIQQTGYSQYYDLPPGTLSVQITYGGNEFALAMPFIVAQNVFGCVVCDDCIPQIKFPNGATCDFPSNWKEMLSGLHCYRNGNYRGERISEFDYTFDTLAEISKRLPMNNGNLSIFLKAVVRAGWPVPEIKTDGIKKLWDQLLPVAAQLMEHDPLAFVAYRSLAVNSGRSIDGVKVSVVFNEVLKDTRTPEQISEALKGFWGGEKTSIGRRDLEGCVRNLGSYKDRRKKVLKSQANRAFTKLMQDVEYLTIDKQKYPKTWAAIEAGDLPVGTFFRKSEQYFLLNDNWGLWEEMYKRGFGEQAAALAGEVRGRTTYEKDLMSYLYFILYGLPAYLKKHTGHKWKCIPKLVTSSSELEPPKEEDGDAGVVRKRSALTPIVDNEAKTVEVPYASLSIGGSYGTTYCYSHDYHVLYSGFSFGGNVVMEDIEEKLNGRDDYGLMFYTLTGSAQGRGYPTFLIIFERRGQKGDTKVHFHRTHPSRSKDGDYNPIHNWIKVCYNWMAGNIRADRIKAQQGDLAFVQVKVMNPVSEIDLDGAAIDLAFDHQVNAYDSHAFDGPVDFAEYKLKQKSNILGYVRLNTDSWLRHPEHDDVLIPAGTYAIHQCRSWEANPKGVWSLRID